MADSILVGFDYAPEKGDNAVLIVGRKKEGGIVDIINAFDGEEAKTLYNKLIGKEKEDE